VVTIARLSRFHLGSLMIVVAAAGLVLSLVQFVDSGTEPRRQALLRQAAEYRASEIEAQREATANDRLAAEAKTSGEADYYRGVADELRADAEDLRLLSERSLRAAAQEEPSANPRSPQTRPLLKPYLPPETGIP
jgi:hypothetical protein